MFLSWSNKHFNQAWIYYWIRLKQYFNLPELKDVVFTWKVTYLLSSIFFSPVIVKLFPQLIIFCCLLKAILRLCRKKIIKKSSLAVKKWKVKNVFECLAERKKIVINWVNVGNCCTYRKHSIFWLEVLLIQNFAFLVSYHFILMFVFSIL